MLTPEEEQKLNLYLELLKDVFGSVTGQTQVWLAEKLKEVNEELKVMKHLYQGINPKDIDQAEKDYNQMIQDVKYVHNTTLKRDSDE